MQMHEEMILGRIKELLKNSLVYLKDEKYQQKIWFKEEGPEIDSYSDTCLHFIGCCESIFKYDKSQNYLGDECHKNLKKLYDLVSEHFDSLEKRIDPDLLQENELLNDPKWHDIQSLAEVVETQLNEFVKGKENERQDKK